MLQLLLVEVEGRAELPQFVRLDDANRLLNTSLIPFLLLMALTIHHLDIRSASSHNRRRGMR